MPLFNHNHLLMTKQQSTDKTNNQHNMAENVTYDFVVFIINFLKTVSFLFWRSRRDTDEQEETLTQGYKCDE